MKRHLARFHTLHHVTYRPSNNLRILRHLNASILRILLPYHPSIHQYNSPHRHESVCLFQWSCFKTSNLHKLNHQAKPMFLCPHVNFDLQAIHLGILLHFPLSSVAFVLVCQALLRTLDRCKNKRLFGFGFSS
jgi:hypothetical protein